MVVVKLLNQRHLATIHFFIIDRSLSIFLLYVKVVISQGLIYTKI